DQPGTPVRFRRHGEGLTGNLVFLDGRLWSQSVSRLTAFSEVDVRLAQVEGQLGRTPRDPRTLLDRAELRRDRGDLAGAMADLRLARAGLASPAPGTEA